MKKRDIITGTIAEYDFPNKGSFMCGDRKVTIKGALPGQEVSAQVIKLKSGRAEARTLEVLKPSPLEDSKPVCSHFGQCGGCSYQTMSYENQLKLKADMVKKLLDGVINTEENPYKWEGIIGSPVTSGYRNKMEYSFGDEYKDGPLALGLHKKNSMYDIVQMEDCDIVSADYNMIVGYTVKFCKENNLPYYKKIQHTGLLRHLVIRQSYTSKELLINLVTSSQNIEDMDLNRYISGLLELETSGKLTGKIAGILHTTNDSMADAVICEKLDVLYGTEFIYEELLGLKFKISPFSFFQTNTASAERLYSKAREYVGDTRDKVIFDLYSGTGTIAQMLSAVARKVVGVEIVSEAVDAARVNAELNGLDNCEFIAGDVLKVIDTITDKPDIIVLDPPRDGINPKALEKIIAYGVDELVYISCKPTSLARDLVTLQERGYRVVKACAVDQFVNTVHVETVVLLSQQKPDDTIEIDLDLDELDATSAELKATYQEIKDYVLKEFGLKVSSLYISQVKRKCGIEVGENYNLPKSENARVPQCPKEKEEAIKAALKYFAMI